MYQNSLVYDPTRVVLFLDMCSYFATCEQQVNYGLRHRPIGTCVYTGWNGAVIALSIEAKQRGLKGITTISEAFKICKDFIPVETHPTRYREFHVKIMNVLRKYTPEVYPKSIDEAVANLTDYKLVYKDAVELARTIQRDINRDVGDYFKCKIGIAPNAFLGKLGTEIAQKPGDIVVITKDNLDAVLRQLKLTDLPGIAAGMERRLMNSGIRTPLELRYADPSFLRRAVHSIVGTHWHYRLNFGEMDMYHDHDYKTMQQFRQISKKQRESLDTLEMLLRTHCIRLEKRMVDQNVFCNTIIVFARYNHDDKETFWNDKIRTAHPTQDAIEMFTLISSRMQKYQEANHCEPVINHNMTALGVQVMNFIPAELVQVQLFEKNIQKNTLRTVKYNIKDKFGWESVLFASEMGLDNPLKDVIGFGSVKDINRPVILLDKATDKHYVPFFFEDPDLNIY